MTLDGFWSESEHWSMGEIVWNLDISYLEGKEMKFCAIA